MSWIFVGVAILALVILTFSAVYLARKENTRPPVATVQSDDNHTSDRKDTYIQPAEFKVGLDPPKPYKSANLCNDKVLYPINALEVDYGSKASDCPCTQFVQAP